MARWEPNTGERLQEAALDLFERGYDKTTAAEIAARAGTAKSTFFRLFPDKREVLFAGTGELAEQAVTAIAAVAPGATAFEVIDAALRAIVAVFDPEKRAWYARRQQVIDRNPELRERELLKRQAQAEAITAAIRAGGHDGLTPEVLAALIGLALNATYTRWTSAPGDQDPAELAGKVLAELRTTVTTLE